MEISVPSFAEATEGKEGKTLLSWKVIGMDSAHCAMTVEQAIKTLAGIEKVEADFNNARAKIIFDPEKVSEKDIERVIEEAGYKPIKETGETEDLLEKEKKEKEKELGALRKKVIIGGLLSVFIFLGSFPEWFSFVPGALNNYFVLLLLTTPVQFWVGSRFYRGLVLLFKYKTADMNTLISIGTLAAYFYSAFVAFFPNIFVLAGENPKIYFDTSAIIITLILLGRYFVSMAKGRASE